MRVPGWLWFVCLLATTFNVLVAISVASLFFRPGMVFGAMTSDAAIGLHLQLFEAILASIGISLAVFGFIGFNFVRNAAEKRATDTAREVAERVLRGKPGSSGAGGYPDIKEYDPEKITREEEGGNV